MQLDRRFTLGHLCATATLVIVSLALLGAPARTATAGPLGPQVTGGWYRDSNDFFLGFGVRFGVARVSVIPNAEWLFQGSGTEYTLNLDATMNVLPLGVATGYVGAGLGWLTEDPKDGNSSRNNAVNLIAGVGVNSIPFRPFAQFKYVIVEGDDPRELSIGARF